MIRSTSSGLLAFLGGSNPSGRVILGYFVSVKNVADSLINGSLLLSAGRVASLKARLLKEVEEEVNGYTNVTLFTWPGRCGGVGAM